MKQAEIIEAINAQQSIILDREARLTATAQRHFSIFSGPCSPDS